MYTSHHGGQGFRSTSPKNSPLPFFLFCFPWDGLSRLIGFPAFDFQWNYTRLLFAKEIFIVILFHELNVCATIFFLFGFLELLNCYSKKNLRVFSKMSLPYSVFFSSFFLNYTHFFKGIERFEKTKSMHIFLIGLCSLTTLNQNGELFFFLPKECLLMTNILLNVHPLRNKEFVLQIHMNLKQGN